MALRAEELAGDFCSDEVISVTNAWNAVGVGSLYVPIAYVLEDENITSNTTLDDCSFEVDDVTVSNSSLLTLDYDYEAIILTDFVIESESSLLIY